MKRFDVFSGNIVPIADGPYGLFTEARAEIDSRDKRIAELSSENRALQTKVAAQGKRIAALQADLANPSRFLA